MDSTNLSFSDFFNMPDVDIMERANKYYELLEDLREKKHLQYKRVANEGTGEIREMAYLASNDYLNLTRHPKVVEAGRIALEKYGAGAGSVPLLGGTLDIHNELEERVAAIKGCEDAIIYTSGFGSNAGTLLSMLLKEDVAILVMLVHASIIDGCKNTNIKFFKHNDMDSLESVLKKVKDKYRTKLIAVDGVYSMDGDIAPLDEIVEIAKKYGAYVMVDEAHATGVIGENGRGTPEYFYIEGKVDIVAGTFSKAVGGVGGFIATNKELVSLLNFYSRTYMFSTAMTPQATASIIEALNVIESEPDRRERLWENIRYFKKNLEDLGFCLGNSETAIFPIIVGDELKVREMCRYLHEADIYANPVLYPAVPKRLSRIRMSLMCEHTKEHLDKALNALEAAGKKYGII